MRSFRLLLCIGTAFISAMELSPFFGRPFIFPLLPRLCACPHKAVDLAILFLFNKRIVLKLMISIARAVPERSEGDLISGWAHDITWLVKMQ